MDTSYSNSQSGGGVEENRLQSLNSEISFCDNRWYHNMIEVESKCRNED
jgi:hypothetical protein